MAKTIAESQARARKALLLADTLTAAGAKASTVAQAFTALDWATAAEAAGVRVPSQATRDLVVALLAHRERQTESDPFAGLVA